MEREVEPTKVLDREEKNKAGEKSGGTISAEHVQVKVLQRD